MLVFALALLIFGAASALHGKAGITTDWGYYGPENHIINGEKAKKGDWPWQLSLEAYYAQPGVWGHTCGASLLSPRWALTAAHCVDGREEGKFRVAAGESVIYPESDAEQVVDVAQIFKHENYNPPTAPLSNDITLLKLADDIKVNKYVKFAKLPTPDMDDKFPEANCWSTGFGTEGGQNTQIPGFLKEASLDVLSTAECRERMPLNLGAAITDKQLCVFDKRPVNRHDKNGVCQGDSGGPVQCMVDDEFYVLGAASFVVRGIFSYCNPSYPGVYTRASAYREWIQNISGLEL